MPSPLQKKNCLKIFNFLSFAFFLILIFLKIEKGTLATPPPLNTPLYVIYLLIAIHHCPIYLGNLGILSLFVNKRPQEIRISGFLPFSKKIIVDEYSTNLERGNNIC